MAKYEFQWDGNSWTTTKRVPFLEDPVEVAIISEDMEQQSPTPRQIAMIDALDRFPNSTIQAIDDAAEEYRLQVDEGIDLSEYGLGHINRGNIRQHYQIEAIIIPRMAQSQYSYHFVAASCDWEEEHGMEILFENHRIISCGMQDCLYLNEEWDDYISDDE